MENAKYCNVSARKTGTLRYASIRRPDQPSRRPQNSKKSGSNIGGKGPRNLLRRVETGQEGMWRFLEDRILFQIFSYLKNSRDHLNYLCVCRQWLRVGIEAFELIPEDVALALYERGKRDVARSMIMEKREYHDAEDSYNILVASEFEDWETVIDLLKMSNIDPSADDNYAIQAASYCGQDQVVALLLLDPRVDPSAENNYAIQAACEMGHSHVVKRLLKDKRVDPTCDDDYPLKIACQNGHFKVVKALLKDGRTNPRNVQCIANGRTDIYLLLEKYSSRKPRSKRNGC